MTTTTAPAAFAHLTHVELLDFVNRLLQFDTDGRGADTAMGLMRWNHVTADELNARRMNAKRAHYRPTYT